jgi:hypothetical protein
MVTGAGDMEGAGCPAGLIPPTHDVSHLPLSATHNQCAIGDSFATNLSTLPASR